MYLGQGGDEEYVISIQNMWNRAGLSDPNIHLDLNTVFSNVSIPVVNQTGVNNNIHLVNIEKQYATDRINELIRNNTIITDIKEPFATHVDTLNTYTPIHDRVYLGSGLYKFNFQEDLQWKKKISYCNSW